MNENVTDGIEAKGSTTNSRPVLAKKLFPEGDNMPDVDFAMAYPCYFLLTETGNPEHVTSDGNRVNCILTDRDLAESFYKDKYGDNFTSRAINVDRCDSKEALINTLRDWEPQLADQHVFYLAVNATPGRLVARVLNSRVCTGNRTLGLKRIGGVGTGTLQVFPRFSTVIRAVAARVAQKLGLNSTPCAANIFRRTHFP